MAETEKPENEEKEEAPKEAGASANSENPEAAPPPKKGKKIILILIPILLLIVGGLVYFLLLKKDKAPEETEHSEPKHGDVFKGDAAANQNFFVNLDDFVVDLSSQSNKPSFLKLSLTLNLYKEEDTAEVNNKMPIIRDNFQLYLRELRETDLNGSGGMYRLKEELLVRLNKILYPVQVKDILFREILIR